MVKSPEYLEDDFDANKLTKPQLRSILSSHGVVDLPPTAARKEVLLELFESHVRAQAAAIKKAVKVKASDKGISFLDEKSHPSPKRSPPRAKSRRGRTAEGASKSKSRKTKREISKSPTRGKGRRGRSPTKELSVRFSTPSPSPRRSPTRLNSPLSVLQHSLPRYSDSPQAATAKLHDRLEFIAKANRLTDAKHVIEPRKSPRSQSPIRAAILKTHPSKYLVRPIVQRLSPILRFLFIGLVSILVGSYIRFKFFYPIPYCQSGVTLNRYLPKSAKDFYAILKELCVPCPVHGQCRQGVLTCEEGFIQSPNWIALGSSCVPDYRKLTLVDNLVSKARSMLSERAGKAICGELDELARVMTDTELGQLLQETFLDAEWNSPQFESFYRLALQDLGKNSASYGIEISHNPMYCHQISTDLFSDGQIMLQSKNPSIGIKCRVGIILQNFYDQFFFQIWISFLILFSSLVLGIMGYNKSKTARRVEELVQAVLQILAEQDALNRRDPTVSSTISVHQIRDALFFKTSARIRNRLWPKVSPATTLIF